jgi:hypothetical protein
MTARRAPDFNLGHALSDPGFTPRVRDVPALLEYVATGDDLAEAASQSLLRVGVEAGLVAAKRAAEAAPIERFRLTRLVGRLAADGEGSALTPFLLARLAGTSEALAAALAREGGVLANDIVWDPFMGSGMELCERAVAGPEDKDHHRT